MSIEIARRVRCALSDAVVRQTITAALRCTRTRGDVSVAFVGPTRMRELNRTYHGEDRVTDVLAFSGEDGALGELILCPPYVRQQAARAGESFRRELTRVLIHGTLHLLGYDHARPRDAERMFGLQERLVSKLH